MIKTLSLFSGAGGLDIGFHQAGYDIVGCVEIEKQYCSTLIANRDNGKYFNRNAKIYCKDIREFDPTEFENMGIECVIGGPPCQPFSAAGRRTGGVPGIQDERGLLFESYCRVLEVLKPKVFVFENVYGLKGANNGEPWKEIVSSFSKIGYEIEAEIIDAADYGVPQHRERLILVGTMKGKFIFPEPTHGPDSSSGKKLVTIWDAIKDIQDENDKGEEIGGLYGHLLPLVPEGLNYSFFTKEMGYPEPYFAWRSKFHDFLYKADRNRPSRTLKAQPGKFTGPFHWNNRHFSIDELKRMQSFPDDYVITGTNTQIIAQIGNSVPPRLGMVLAESVKEQILRPNGEMKYKLRDATFVSTFRKRQREISASYKETAKREIEKRFGVHSETEKEVNFEHTYYVGFFSKYSKDVMVNKPSASRIEKYIFAFKVKVECCKKNISISVNPINKENVVNNVKVNIVGLEKYLIKIDSLELDSSITCIDNIFEVWDIIQKELIDMSQFYSIIDIYGHYANRGDTVKICTGFLQTNEPILRALEFFGNSNNCGIYLSRAELADNLGVAEEEVDGLIMDLRNLRFDVRTSMTHPTIRTDEVICTYPFPMLSERAQFDKNRR